MNTQPDLDETRLREFVQKVESALQPGLSEVLTDETRKTQRALLVVALIIMLIAWDAIQFTGNFEMAGIRFVGAVAEPVVLKIACTVCFYLELVAAMRSFTEWHSWRTRTMSTELDAESINASFQSVVAEANVDVLQRNIYGLRDTLSPEQIAAAPQHLQGALMRRRTLRIFGPHYRRFLRGFAAYTFARRARLILEIFFPLTFGAVAIVSGVGSIVRVAA